MAGSARALVLGLGEILWDLLPAGKQLGGAPANFAYHARALGVDGVPVSAVGEDELGREILGRLERIGLPRDFVATVSGYPTGTVEVKLRDRGVPEYIIHEDVAWDFIPQDQRLMELARMAQVICFGSLAQRSEASRATIQGLLMAAGPSCIRIFDINLRQKFYSRSIIESSLEKCQVLKLNDQELPVVAELFGLKGGGEEAARAILKRFSLRMVALTRGAQGSRLYTPQGAFDHPGYPVEVVDTVGAGDSFTAALAVGLLREDSPDRINDSANRVAARVCGHRGAVP